MSTTPVCAITQRHCHLQGVRYFANACEDVCDLAPEEAEQK